MAVFAAPAVRRALAVACVFVAGLASGCAHRDEVPPPRDPERASRDEPALVGRSLPSAALPAYAHGVQSGYATWYGARLAGHRTASGERFDPAKMTAAHRTLPLGTWVEVTSLDTGERVRVRINDRGPFGHPERIIDLSRAAADRLGIRALGIARVAIRVVGGP